MSLFPALSRNC